MTYNMPVFKILNIAKGTCFVLFMLVNLSKSHHLNKLEQMNHQFITVEII